MTVVRWLPESDPAIRWQVLRDLTDAPGDAVAAERSRIASEGWGARLLELQSPGGHWGAERRTTCWSAACSARFPPARSSTGAGRASCSRPAATTTYCADWSSCGAPAWPPDERVREAIERVRKRRHQDGRWPLHRTHAEKIPFAMEAGLGKASRCTLRALRVLAWHGG